MLPPSLLRVFPALLLSGAILGAAENDRVDIRTRDGREFNDVLARASGRFLEVRTAEGAQLLPFKDLPLALQERYFPPSMLHPPQVGDALDFKTNDGHVFKGKLTNITPNGISMETPDGVVKVPYSNLPPELANTFEYDAGEAVKYEIEQRRAAAARQAEELARENGPLKKATPKPTGKSFSSSKKATPNPSLGESGRKKLGVPKLGGSGLGK